MDPRAIQAIFWLALFGFWVIVSRNNHPDLICNIVATSVLLLASAMAVVADRITRATVIKRANVRYPWTTIVHGISIAVIGVLLGLVAASIIKIFYDLYVGNDPRRFPFVNNVAMDSGFVALHVLLFQAMFGYLRKRSRRKQVP